MKTDTITSGHGPPLPIRRRPLAGGHGPFRVSSLVSAPRDVAAIRLYKGLPYMALYTLIYAGSGTTRMRWEYDLPHSSHHRDEPSQRQPSPGQRHRTGGTVDGVPLQCLEDRVCALRIGEYGTKGHCGLIVALAGRGDPHIGLGGRHAHQSKGCDETPPDTGLN